LKIICNVRHGKQIILEVGCAFMRENFRRDLGWQRRNPNLNLNPNRFRQLAKPNDV